MRAAENSKKRPHRNSTRVAVLSLLGTDSAIVRLGDSKSR